MSYTNLLKETERKLEQFGYTWADVQWIRCKKKRVPVERFIEIAKGTEYDSGYGGHEIDGSLKIRAGRHLFVRGVYDGSEWWEPIDLSAPTEEWQGDTFRNCDYGEKDDDCIGGE